MDMDVTMEHNFDGDSFTGEGSSYIPTTVDATIRTILEHRGVPETRIAMLLADLDGSCTLATYEMETLLPCASMTHLSGYRHDFRVILARNVTWTGDTLTLPAQGMPDTVMAALPGRRLREVFEHPCLPDRIILSAERDKYGSLIVRVPLDARPVIELSRATAHQIAAIPTRSRVRRAWIDARSQATCESEWSGWLDDQRAEGVRRFLSGVTQVADEHCWGGPSLSPMPIVRMGTGSVRTLLGRLRGTGDMSRMAKAA